ncbi:DNA methyltransferase [Priestia megaterium]|uniref:DNA methyltransferase n=1 Tax=Priestia megaterium TaxID=1404 RepID=UPI000BFDAC71|nr:DNA methyltransferase [Priestia megaterium]PGR79746.1 SAM-dependent methyltransferase [Priestia megaterium]
MKLTWEEIESNAIAFSKKWKDCQGDERQEAQKFEMGLMNIFGIDFYEGLHEYQIRDINGRIGYIDYLLPSKILIEMKSKGESLVRAYNQAYDYVKSLNKEDYPELLLVSDFNYIQVTNLRTMQTFKKFKISQLKNHVRMLGVLAGYTSNVTFKTDIEVNTDASYKMAKLHDALEENGYTGENLEQYLVRLLFCLFAEDTGIFEQGAFENYIKDSKADGSDLSSRIMSLFDTLNTPEHMRMKNLPTQLKNFRYINGKIFSKPLPPAYFDNKMRQLLLDCCNFNWSYISPAIFGAMFQGVMNPLERRELGAHYTSEENILKTIKPLFLDNLWREFERSKSTKNELERFLNKIARIKILDPACGCGNFLIIAYREIRLLEFEVLKMLHDNKQLKIIDTLCRISIENFYGIEYEEFPSQVAQLSLLLMKHQLDKEISNYFGMNTIDFPIRETANIIHGNALRIDWNSLVYNSELSYIIGNPPFRGKRWQSDIQKEDMALVFGKKFKGVGNLDYVTAWYKKAADYIHNTSIDCAFVSTNSVVQGEHVSYLWKPLIKDGISIIFSYRTFKWSNEAKNKASVFAVIIGFSKDNRKREKRIYFEDESIKAKNISPYLIDMPNVIVERRSKPICPVPKMLFGNKATDGGNLLLSPEEKDELISKEPLSEKFIRPYVMGHEFINNIKRYCLWLKNATPNELRKMPLVRKRLEEVRKMRENSTKIATQKLALTPTLFDEDRQPEGQYLAVPVVSSERRKYIPIGFLESNIIAGAKIFMVPDANIYHFGILTSNLHMIWMRTVGGRLKSDYNYSNSIIYNNFPWPKTTEKQREIITQAAIEILRVRSLYQDCSLADLYDPISMPHELLKAHETLDKEVVKAYGFKSNNDASHLESLMKVYLEYTENSEQIKVK